MKNKRIGILNNLLSQIEAYIPFKDKTNTSISNSDVGWQLDHALKVINGVSLVLVKTDPTKYKKNFNIMRTVLFPLCYIPRGKVKSPKTVLPPESIALDDLHKQLQTAKKNINQVKTLDAKAYFEHFIFGMLSKKQTLRFLEMHTKHHLKIVRDIIKK